MLFLSRIRNSRSLNDSVAMLSICCIFSSALLYNRVEGIIVFFALISAILSFNLSAWHRDKNSQNILALQLIFAVSILLTGYEILGRSLVDSSHAIEFFGSLTGFSLLGFLSYHFGKKLMARDLYSRFSVSCA